MMSTRLLQYLLLLLMVLPLGAKAELDIVQSRMLVPYSTPLRWDNLERAPEWLRGAQPILNKDSRIHTVHLAPKAWIEVRIPENETLRIVSINQPLVPENLRILVSNGTGLYVEPVMQVTADHKNWLAHTDANSPAVYRLENTGDSTDTIEIALFASRHTYMGELAPYRQLIALPTEEVALRKYFDATAQRFWKLNSEQTATLKVTGPRRLALESRMHYPIAESKMLQSWRVSAWLDGALLHTAEMESNVETLQEVTVNRSDSVTSRVERTYLDIPAGEHQLRLQSSAPLYARLLQQDSTDYSFPALNQPRLPAETARNSLDPQKTNQSIWSKAIKALQAAIAPDVESTEVEQSAQRLAMDNHWREGGLAGAALLDQAAQAHTENQAIKTRADTFVGAHTFFRDLLPKDKVEHADMTYRWYRLPRLDELGKEDRNLVVAPQHTQDLLDHLGRGYFITLPAKSTSTPLAEPPPQKSFTEEKSGDIVLFKNDSSYISAEEQSKLQRLAKRWHETGGRLLEVHGHTDSNAGINYNQKLSERRADAVLRALTALGVRATIVNVAGYGKSSPVADNATSIGRQKNRRVEITLQRQMENIVTNMPAVKPVDIALYQLPNADAPRTLRIAAYAAHDTEFFVQIDQQAIRRLRLSPSNRLAQEAFSPSLGEGGLLLQQLESDTNHDGTQSAAFARSRVAAPMIAAGVIELTLPASGKEVRLWRVAEADDGLHVAVQYQASAAFQLSEREFLSLYDLNQDSGLPLREALLKHEDVGLDPSSALLASQWRPLMRLLASEYRLAKAGVHEQATPTLNSIDGTKAAKAARAAEIDKQWLLVLEQWSKVWFSNSAKSLREEAEWGRINALQHLGEDFMFEQMLKQILFFDADTARQIRAFKLLEAQYRTTSDDESLLRLYALAVQQRVDANDWHQLTQSLLDNGEFRLALLAGLALPPEQRPTELLLQSSWRLGWWQTFDQLSLDLKSPEQRAYWLGMRAAAHSQFETASEQFKAAGVSGQAYVRHISEGLALRNTLMNTQSTDMAVDKLASVKLETYKKWSDWQTDTPGLRVWRDTPESIKDFAGALPGYAIDRDLHFSLYKATASRPLQLKVTGPAKLRLEVRPIHVAGNVSTLEGWVTATSAQGLWTAPITANQPSEGLQLVDGTIVGRKVLLEVPVAAGSQTIKVNAGALPIAVRVYIEQPALPIGILHTPPLSEVSDPHAEQIEFEPILQTNAWFRRCVDCLSVTDTESSQPTKYYRIFNSTPHPVLAPEVTANQPLESIDREAQLLASSSFDQLLDNIPLKQDQPDLVLRRMTLLLNIAESSPKHYERCLAAGQALGFANPSVDGLSRLLDRLSRNSSWNAQETVQESAGVRLLPVMGWQPESPSSRIQKALLAPLAANEQIISGNARMVLSVLNSQSGKVAFELLAEDLGGLPPQALQVLVQRDDEAVNTITLSPNTGWQKQSVNLTTGRHALRFSIQNPVANQLLHIRLNERNGQPVSNQFERMYQVATAKQPLRAILPGPVWLRIDEWREMQTQSRYQYLAEPWQTITLAPEAGRAEALYRLHLRSPAPAQAMVAPRYVTADTVSIPTPPVQISGPEMPSTVRLVDEFKLGTQEDGTWTLETGYKTRYDIDKTGGGFSQVEKDASNIKNTSQKIDPTEKKITFGDTLANFDWSNYGIDASITNFSPRDLLASGTDNRQNISLFGSNWFCPNDASDNPEVLLNAVLHGNCQKRFSVWNSLQGKISLDKKAQFESDLEVIKNSLTDLDKIKALNFTPFIGATGNKGAGKETTIDNVLTYRYFDAPNDTYYTAQGYIRPHEDRAPVLGGKLRADFNPWNLPINAFTEGSLFTQASSYSGDQYWTAHLKAGISEKREFNPKLWHSPYATVFAHLIDPKLRRISSQIKDRQQNIDAGIAEAKAQIADVSAINTDIRDKIIEANTLNTELSVLNAKSVLNNILVVSPNNSTCKQLSTRLTATRLIIANDADYMQLANITLGLGDPAVIVDQAIQSLETQCILPTTGPDSLLSFTNVTNGTDIQNVVTAFKNRLFNEVFQAQLDAKNNELPTKINSIMNSLATNYSKLPIKYSNLSSLVSSLSASFRALNKDVLTLDSLDQDVFTEYTNQHRFGYEIGDRFTYRPYLDTLLSAGASVTSNENLVTPDKLGFNLEFKQLLGNWQANAHLMQSHYFKDADRNNITNRSEFGVGLRWEHWTSQQDRLELLLNINHNIQLSETAGWLGLRWNFDNGRAYRDFRPGEIDFRDLRERNVPNQPNNRIEAVEP